MPRIDRVDDLRIMRPYILECFKMLGKDFKNCEECGVSLYRKKWHIHHTKYDGATLYDLMIVCVKCNMAPHNRRLN